MASSAEASSWKPTPNGNTSFQLDKEFDLEPKEKISLIHKVENYSIFFISEVNQLHFFFFF